MAEIGKSLVFYLKYFAEMNQLYDEEKLFPELKKHSDLEAIKEKIVAVGDAACAEAVVLLDACVSDVLTRLKTDDRLKLKVPKRSTVEKNWEIKLNLRTHDEDDEGKYVRQIGISLTDEGLLPWIWCRGGLEAEDMIRDCLSPGVECHGSKKMGYGSGAVGLSTILVPWESADDFTLESDDIAKQTRKVFDDAITPAFIKKFMALG